MKRFAAAVAGCLALQACAGLGAPPPAPSRTVPVPAGWRTDVGPKAPAPAQWWTVFGDPVLSGLVETALAENRDVLAAAARVAEFEALTRAAEAARLPTLNAGVTAARARALDPFLTPREATVVQPQLQAAYEIDLWGRLSELTGAARANLAATEAARDAAALSVAASTATAYLTLRGLDARLEVARAALASRDDALRIAQNRFREGYISRLELSQARAERDATAQLIPQLQLAASRQEDALAVLLGRPPAGIARGAPLEALTPPPVPDALPSQLLRRRPDIRQAEALVAASDRNLAAARDQLLPTVQISATAGAFSTSALGLGNPATLWNLGGSVLAPLFQGGRLRAGVGAAAARRDQAVYAYQRAVLAAFADTEDGLASVQRLREQITALEQQRAALAEAFRVAQNRYGEGYAAYLDVLDAQRSLLNADLSLVQARTDLLTSEAALYRAVGGGWSGPAS